MDFSFTPEQTMLRDSVARYLDRHYGFAARQQLVHSDRAYSTEVWQHLVELGLPSLPFPESVGGVGGSVVDLVAIGEPFGEHLVVEPYLPSVLLAGGALASVGDHPGAAAWLARIIAGEAELLLLAVHKSAQRRGVGGKLLARFIEDARSRGADKLHLEVRHGNHAAELYKRAGFEEVGRRFNYYRGASGHLYDALTLARPVNN